MGATATVAAPTAAAPARRRRPGVVLALVAALAVVLLLRAVVAEPFGIPSQSMAPTIARGDHVLVDKLAYRGGDLPRHGELVVFHAPRTNEITLKRVVATSGQTVEIRDGLLYVDGRRRREPYTDPDAIDSVFFGPVTVAAGSVFVLGDNRGDSTDSRRFGSVPASELIGRARARIWPPSRWGTLE
jgi:signal peptidase I